MTWLIHGLKRLSWMLLFIFPWVLRLCRLSNPSDFYLIYFFYLGKRTLDVVETSWGHRIKDIEYKKLFQNKRQVHWKTKIQQDFLLGKKFLPHDYQKNSFVDLTKPFFQCNVWDFKIKYAILFFKFKIHIIC